MSELDKWSKVHEAVVTVEEFLEWLESRGIILAQKYNDSERLYPTYRNRRKLLEEYFEIDATKLERERRELLENARIKNQGGEE